MKVHNNLISVIMSTKDTPEYMLKQSIYSILNQTYKNIEFIIVSDGSDSDYEIIKSIKDDRITVIRHNDSIGLTKSLNEAIRRANGKYIARMDSDDISFKDRLKQQYEIMEKKQDIDICSTFAKCFDKRNNYITNFYTKGSGIKEQLFNNNCIVHPSVMIRKSFLEKYKLNYNEKFIYTQDYEFWSRACFLGKIYVIPKVLLFYRMHAKQISSSKISIQNKLCEEIYGNNLKRLKILSTENIKFMMYLGKKEKNEYSKEAIENFVDTVLIANKKYKIYDEKKLRKIMYINMVSSWKENNGDLLLDVIIKKGLLTYYIKKICNIVKYKLLNKDFRREMDYNTKVII